MVKMDEFRNQWGKEEKAQFSAAFAQWIVSGEMSQLLSEPLHGRKLSLLFAQVYESLFVEGQDYLQGEHLWATAYADLVRHTSSQLQ